MTAYAFDLDGTLDRPALAQLANDLHDAGHEVWVITGGLADTGEWTLEAREQKLAALGVRCAGIVRCINPDIRKLGALKGRECARLGITVMVDDSLPYLEGAAGASSAVRLLVL
jgi:hypothetical protein